MSQPPTLPLTAVEALERLAESRAKRPGGLPSLDAILDGNAALARGVALLLRRSEAAGRQPVACLPGAALSAPAAPGLPGRASAPSPESGPPPEGQGKPRGARVDEPAAAAVNLGHPWKEPPLTPEELERVPVGSVFGLGDGRWLWQGPRYRWAFTPWEAIPEERKRFHAEAEAALRAAGIVRLLPQASVLERLESPPDPQPPAAPVRAEAKAPRIERPARRVLGPGQERARAEAEAEGERAGRAGEPASACRYAKPQGGYRARWLVGHARGAAAR